VPVQIESRPTSSLFPDRGQPRKQFDADRLAALAASLRKKQWYPLLVRPSGEILDGEYRWRAAGLGGVESLDVVVVEGEVSKAEAVEVQLVTALHRTPLSPFEQANGFRDWLAGNPDKTARDLALRLDKDPSLVCKYLSVFNAAPAVREAAEAGRLGPTQWYPISLLPTDRQGEALQLHLAGGVSRDRLAAACRRRRPATATAPPVRRSRVVCPLPTGARVVVTGPEMSLDELAETFQTALDAVRRAKRDSLDVKTAQRVWADKAKAGA
jgi:ParB/RepB/Spo0J family partition protein